MELTDRFVVPAPADRVWELFDDIPEVVACMPGAQVTERIDDQTYNATLTIAVGPIRPKFDVRATIERDDSTREGRIQVHAVDKKGGSQARAQIVYKVGTEGSGTAVDLTQTVTLTGPLAQFGRTGVIEDINAQMTRQFAECLAKKLAGPEAPEDGDGPGAVEVSDRGESADEVAKPAAAKEIRIVPLLARTLSARILKALRLRR